ncbi:extracellular solute-binding protein [Agrobacterium vitis]|uniref:extracellular solute-binding protein n=1 Tax=Agrobacterium vitis TaxID=373 RepID=UPI000872D814|nr:extracellular solute-binding protein [Agrobacterium vitis]MCE6077981.1 extracellular solute-binding protein [Agrobacterium vitis]MCM2451239.1 extracellular solute-binding protein [Agrobacterium vitis]MUO72813.1 extracellular solute-binding protein [Agrobacterium vitis]MUO86712.1 extracellular solute-binding protein [Agrobacterium vitis]MVA37489.1 extracellular solute-binding protein [Agrobacterium vitis]
MKKNRHALTLVALLVAPVGGNASDMITGDTVGPADAPNKMTFRMTTDGPRNNDPVVAEGYGKLFNQFIAKHPGWRIELQMMTGDISQEQARMVEQAKSGNAPDCAAVDSFVLPVFKKAGVLKSFSPYFTKEEIDQLFPFIREGVTGADGQIYAWWWSTDLRVLYRNKEIIPDAPQTWDETKKAALHSVEEGMEGILFNGSRYEGTTFDWLANFWAEGGKLVDENGKPIFGEGAEREKFVKAVNYYRDLVETGAAPKRVATIGNYDDFNAAAAAGTTALFVGGNWQYGQLQAALEPEELAKWTFSPLPGPTKDQRSTGTGGWTVASFASDPAKVKMCADLARDVYMGPANEVQGQLPTRADLYEKYKIFSSDINKAFSEALKVGQARPGAPVYPEISNQIQIMMGKVLTGTQATDAAVDEAFKASLAAYDRH